MKTLVAFLLLSLSAMAQSLGIPYGPSYVGQPGLLLFGNPQVGGGVLALTNRPPATIGTLFLLGLQPDNQPVAFNQTLLVAFATSIEGLPSASGVEDFHFFIVPPTASVSGLHVYFQAVHLYPSIYQLSRGIDVTFF